MAGVHEWLNESGVRHCRGCGLQSVQIPNGWEWSWDISIGGTVGPLIPDDCIGRQLAQLTDVEAEIFNRLLDDGLTPPEALKLAQVVLP